MRHEIIVVVLALYSMQNAGMLRTCIAEKQNKFGYIDGDFMIGAIFPIHKKPRPIGNKNPLACGVIEEYFGIQRVEAAFFAIDSINNDTNILPGTRLGINIRDDCYNELLALHETLELIKQPNIVNKNISKEGTHVKLENKITPLIGIIDSGFSDTITQKVLRAHEIPEIGYSATSSNLKKRKNFPYFLTTVPGDDSQVYLIFEILKRFNWNYISIVYTNDDYGQNRMNKARKMAGDFGLCIARIVEMQDWSVEDRFDNAIQQLLEVERARVVVSFCTASTVAGLLKAIKKKNLAGRYLLIRSQSWYKSYDLERGYEAEAQGSLTIRLKTTASPEFDRYYIEKNLFNNQRNPWFGEFWEYKFGCKINVTRDSKSPKCTGREDLRKDHEQESKISYIIKSIYAFAHGLHNMQTDISKNQTALCSNLLPFNSTKFMDYLLNVTFTYGDELVSFSKFRTPRQIKYSIRNFQKLQNGSYNYVEVGEYDAKFEELGDHNISRNVFERLTLHGKIQFPASSTKPIKSTCSDPCPAGEIQVRASKRGDKLCCWNCVPCGSREFQVNLTSCQECPSGYWPNKNLTGCYEIPLLYSQWMDPQSLISLAFSVLGIILTTATAFIFVKYRDTAVVKSSTRELCYMMLIGMIMTHSLTFAVVSKPTVFVCTVVRTLPSISFTIIYAALLVKTNRIARILAISKKKFPNLNPRFMSIKAQITITLILIMVEMLICAIMLIKEPPIPEMNDHFNCSPPYISLGCPISVEAIFVPFSFVALLVVMCTLYAIKTRNLPDNFNEAKFIGFAMYVTCITWIAFGLVYYGSEFQVITSCICASTNSLVILAFLFFPKLYIILWVPERNTRTNFVTTKSIRVIFGRDNMPQKANEKISSENDSK